MIKIVKADGKAEYEYLAKVRERSSSTDRDVTAVVSEIIDNYHSQIETRDYDYVERFVLLGSLINDYFENQETTVT